MYICKYCGKEFEKKQQLAGHIIWCKENPNRSGKSNFNSNKNADSVRPQDILQNDLYCQFCGKQCKNLNSLRQHEVRCKNNPNRIDIKYNLKNYNQLRKQGKIIVANTNQYTKAANMGLPKPKISDETRKKMAMVWLGKTHSEESKQKISKSMQRVVRERPESYSASNVNGRVKKVEYNGQVFDSSWEVIVAKFLDENGYTWYKPNKGFEYFWEGAYHLYYPDFYVPSIDKYIEVKGYKRNRDNYKWSSLNNLIVIKEKEIKQINRGIYKLVE